MRALKRLRIWGFSAAEIFVVAVVLTVIAGNAIPRLTRGADGIAEAALAGDLAVLRNAIDLYARDHGGNFPSHATFDAQLTQYTDAAGNPSSVADDKHPFGPYLRKVPVLPVGPKGVRATDTVVTPTQSTLGAWLYNPATGEIRAALPDSAIDYTGKRYNAY
ncbi:MAG TPA: hypothetical protein VF669_07530 [Tepidisphaeraceae bacterium]|jgi:type II secretory pathway pseudopilin PulG